MTKELGTDKVHSQNKRQKSKIKEKTNKLKDDLYEKSKIKRLVLYNLGTSSNALSANQIEYKAKKENSNQRPTYVYEVLIKLAPDSDEFTHTLLLKFDEFIDKNNKIKEYSREDKEKLKKKIITRFYESYSHPLGWKDITELQYSEQIKNENGNKFIEITIGNTNAKFIKIVLKVNNASDKDIAKIFYVNRDYQDRNKDIEIPIIIKSLKGTQQVYSTVFDSSYHLRHYLDVISIEKNNKNNSDLPSHSHRIDDNSKRNKKKNRIKKYYVLNLRGLLLYLLLNKKRGRPSFKEINQVIDNLANNYNYWFKENEFQICNESQDIAIDNEKTVDIHKFYRYCIENSFSFLSYYNEYRKFLPENYAADILIETALMLQNRLELMDIPKLNYEVTTRFFMGIEEYFWEYPKPFMSKFEPRITNRDLIPNEMFAALTKFQEKTRRFIRERKEKELKDHCDQTKHYREENFKNELKRKVLKDLEVTDNSVVSIKETLDSIDKTDIDNPWGATMSVVEEICEYHRQDYVISSGDFLIKKTKIGEIKKMLKPEMTFEKVKELLYQSEIYEILVIIDMVELAGYKIRRDMKKNKDLLILKNNFKGRHKND